jgi:hypothetical protein
MIWFSKIYFRYNKKKKGIIMSENLTEVHKKAYILLQNSVISYFRKEITRDINIVDTAHLFIFKSKVNKFLTSLIEQGEIEQEALNLIVISALFYEKQRIGDTEFFKVFEDNVSKLNNLEFEKIENARGLFKSVLTLEQSVNEVYMENKPNIPMSEIFTLIYQLINFGFTYALYNKDEVKSDKPKQD